ncbi:hypothetical protein LMTR13_21790 [Bradyrhizobium icense]|uniref:Uncharacterized protein n=2 Tax=Bradyrhizobium icense TaxID=1274631 RepID=A0A1B1UI36_9BRAD|nr:hypothetical protein LMTR13_21790 [Bradyrhizobium icense]
MTDLPLLRYSKNDHSRGINRMAEPNGDNPQQKKTQQPKVGDRFWFWLEGEPSAFEVMLADALAAFPKSEGADNGVFQVRTYSWRGTVDFTHDFLETHLPRKIELPFDRIITFLRVDDTLNFSIPVPTLSFSDIATAGSIHISPHKYSFTHQTLLILACRQTDHDREPPALAETFDALGLVSILSGHILQGRSLFSSYFCTNRKKFISGTLGVVSQSSVDWTPLKLAAADPEVFDARDDRTHAALWFAGAAFSSHDDAAKVVSYVTAFEILMGKNLQNYVRQLYRRDSELQKLALEKIQALEKLRGDLVHAGRRIALSPELERYAQAFILDAIRRNKNLASMAFAVQSVGHSIRQGVSP